MRNLFVSLLMVFTMGSAMLAPSVAIGPQADALAKCRESYLGVTVWYRGLTDSQCRVKSPGNSDNSLSAFIMKIALNVLAAAFSIAAYVALFFIIKSGFRYMTSAGSSDGMSAAKKGLTNAVIGLIITLLSAVIVNTIVGVL